MWICCRTRVLSCFFVLFFHNNILENRGKCHDNRLVISALGGDLDGTLYTLQEYQEICIGILEEFDIDIMKISANHSNKPQPLN